MRKQKIMVLLGSTRPERQGEKVADWFMGVTKAHKDIEFELVDLKDFKLPLLDEPLPPAAGKYEHEHTKRWAKKVAAYDGYIFITPEYNHGMPAALKNALDFLGKEWALKPIGFIGYGAHLGLRSIEQFRLSIVNLEMVAISSQVEIDLFAQLDENGEFVPSERNKRQAESVIKKIKWWSEVLLLARTKDT